MSAEELAMREKEAGMECLKEIISARKEAVTAMALLAANGKEYSDSWACAFGLESDMQKMLHNQFEV